MSDTTAVDMRRTTTAAERQPVRASVVIVNWNTKDLLLRLLAQLYANATPSRDVSWEIIVVDNASSDGSTTAARAAFPDVVLVEAPRNGGFAYGVNLGIAKAKGDWILLLNTDTEVDAGALERFVCSTTEHPDAGVLGPAICDEHGRTQRSSWPRHGVLRHLADAIGLARFLDNRRIPTHTKDVDCVSGCVFLARRTALQRTGALDERFFMYFEEADLCERIRAAGYAVRFLPQFRFVHAGGLSAGQAAERTFLAFRESCLLYHARWHGRLATEWVRACLLLNASLRWLLLSAVGRQRANLHAAAVRMLKRPSLVRELCARERQVPAVEPAPPR
jgi:GT2 family glycosyltransferase